MTTIGSVEQDLLTFCSGGIVGMVQSCLNHPNIRTGINQIRDSNGSSAVHKAAENGHASVIQLLAQQVTNKNMRLVDLEIRTRSDEWTPLHLAAGHGHLTSVQCLIQYGANVHVCDKYGRTPLHRAAYKGHLTVIQFLHLHGGASIHVADRDGDTPLHDAYHGGHLDVVQYLVENGASQGVHNLGGKTPIECAAHTLRDPNYYPFAAHAAPTPERRRATESPVNDYSFHSTTSSPSTSLFTPSVPVSTSQPPPAPPLSPLMAGGHMWTDVASNVPSPQNDVNPTYINNNHLRDDSVYVTGNGVNGNGVNGNHVNGNNNVNDRGDGDSNGSKANGNSLWSLQAISQAVVKRFPSFPFTNGEQGSDKVNTTASTTNTTTGPSDPHGMMAIIPRGNGPWLDPEIFIAAAGDGDVSSLQSLLTNHTFDINGVSSDCGDTAMHKAAWNGHLDVIRWLVVQGAKTDVANAYGTTPMHWAAAQDHLDVVQCLVENGQADPEKTNDCGWTPLHEASFNGHLTVVQYLTSIKNHHTSSSTSSMMPSRLVAMDSFDTIPEQSEPSMTRGKSKGKDKTLSLNSCQNTTTGYWDTCTSNGYTALHWATRMNHLAVVQCLIATGTDKNLGDDQGDTPLHTAAKLNLLDIVTALMTHPSADVNQSNLLGETPLHLAARGGHLDIAKALVAHGAEIEWMSRERQRPIDMTDCHFMRHFLSAPRENSTGGGNVHASATSPVSSSGNVVVNGNGNGDSSNGHVYDNYSTNNGVSHAPSGIIPPPSQPPPQSIVPKLVSLFRTPAQRDWDRTTSLAQIPSSQPQQTSTQLQPPSKSSSTTTTTASSSSTSEAVVVSLQPMSIKLPPPRSPVISPSHISYPPPNNASPSSPSLHELPPVSSATSISITTPIVPTYTVTLANEYVDERTTTTTTTTIAIPATAPTPTNHINDTPSTPNVDATSPSIPPPIVMTTPVSIPVPDPAPAPLVGSFGTITEVLNLSHFQKITLGKSISSTQLTGGGAHLVVVDYMATWCGPCQKMYPLVTELAKKYPQVHFAKVDVDKNPEVDTYMKIDKLPTFHLFLLGGKVDEMKGTDLAMLETKIMRNMK